MGGGLFSEFGADAEEDAAAGQRREFLEKGSVQPRFGVSEIRAAEVELGVQAAEGHFARKAGVEQEERIGRQLEFRGAVLPRGVLAFKPRGKAVGEGIDELRAG